MTGVRRIWLQSHPLRAAALAVLILLAPSVLLVAGRMMRPSDPAPPTRYHPLPATLVQPARLLANPHADTPANTGAARDADGLLRLPLALPAGTEVHILGRNCDADWLHVQVPGLGAGEPCPDPAADASACPSTRVYGWVREADVDSTLRNILARPIAKANASAGEIPAARPFTTGRHVLRARPGPVEGEGLPVLPPVHRTPHIGDFQPQPPMWLEAGTLLDPLYRDESGAWVHVLIDCAQRDFSPFVPNGVSGWLHAHETSLPAAVIASLPTADEYAAPTAPRLLPESKYAPLRCSPTPDMPARAPRAPVVEPPGPKPVRSR